MYIYKTNLKKDVFSADFTLKSTLFHANKTNYFSGDGCV